MNTNTAITSILDDYIVPVKGRDPTDLEKVAAFRKYVESGKLTSFVPVLPMILNLRGQPYTLDDHIPFEPVFGTRLPHKLVLLCARQSGKSTATAAKGIILANAIPYFNALFITPLYEQVSRFSNNYVKPFIDESPLKTEWCNTGTKNNVLQRSFRNFSKMFFSFAFLDATRIRGIASDLCFYDEGQDVDPSLIPIIAETMSASKWRLSMYAGTPKTLDNTMEGFWLSSSQAEWCVTCENCRYMNVPRMGYDLEKMIGPYRDDISIHKPGVICAKCKNPINPQHPTLARWVHKDETKRWSFPGYHIPQIIMQMHYGYPMRWAELLAKREGYGNTTIAQFYNEVLACSYEKGAKLITKTDLEQASILPWANEPLYGREAIAHQKNYIFRVLGVDWGGGGEVRKSSNKKNTAENMTMSFTTCAVVGLRGDGKLDVIYGRRLLTPHDHLEEARQVLRIYQMFDCNALAHDYNGAGSVRESIVVQAGLPYRQVAPIVYFRSAAKNIMTFHKTDDVHSRNYWILDKARSLQNLCNAIKLKIVRFFKHDYVSEDNRGLQHDFLSLMENKVETARAGDIYMIQRNPHFPDDFAHSVNFAASFIWDQTRSWP